MPPINAFEIVGKLDLYNIPIRTMEIGKREFEYHVGNDFFEMIDGEEFQKGDVAVTVHAVKTAEQTTLDFDLEGKIVVDCDRCLEEMDLPIKTKGHLIVKMGKGYSDDGDEVVIIPEDKGVINISWFIYEFISLAIPMKHIHPYGLCNKDMSKKLSEHTATDDSGEEEYDIDEINDTAGEATDMSADPRWDALKSMKREE